MMKTGGGDAMQLKCIDLVTVNTEPAVNCTKSTAHSGDRQQHVHKYHSACCIRGCCQYSV
jgi:hypothetical protein